jgi:predicted nucleic acid-binding Zn ribbon protein
MGRNDIRLRRNAISSGRIAQHRNYGEIMARHEKEARIKRIVRVFIYFLIIVFMILMFLLVRQIQEKSGDSKPKKSVSAHFSPPIRTV